MKNNKNSLDKTWLYLIQLIVLCVAILFSLFSSAKDRIQYHVQNFDGSTLKVINEQGIVTQSYQYAPFGQQLQLKKPSNLKNPNAFLGGVQDAGDLVYLKQRHYNPVLGRFYQPDPITFISEGHGQTNRYQYGWNDSYSFKDSSGLNPEFLMVTDPRTYYELRAMEFGYDINTWEGTNATAKAVQREAFFEILGWGVGYSIGKIAGGFFSKFSQVESKIPVNLYTPVRWDGEFATKQILGTTMTPGGRSINFHAAERMVFPPKGRTSMSPAEVDQVLDGATNIRKMTYHLYGDTLTIQNKNMIGKPQVVVDAKTGNRIITVINPRVK